MFRQEYADDADDADDELPPLEYDDDEYTPPQQIPLPSSPDNDRAPRIDGAPPTLRRKTSFERVEEFIDSLGRDSTPAASHERRSTSDSHDQLSPLPRTRYWARRVVIDDEDEDASIERGFQDEERGGKTPKQRRAKTSERIREMRERQEAAVPIASRSTAFARFFPQLPDARFGTGQRQSLPSRSAMAAPAIPSYYNSSTHQRIDRKKEEIDRMENVLLPVCVNLSLLQNTRIPPYNPLIKARSTPEVLKTKALPIGKHILSVLKKEPEEKRGALEMDICRYVADTYWPQSVMRADGLRIMEMYRNALFHEELETARLDAWNDGSWEEEEVEKDGDRSVCDKHEDQRETQMNGVVLGGTVVDLGGEEVKGG